MTEIPAQNDAVVHLSGPADGGWHHTVTRDWAAVCPSIGATAYRLWAIARSLVIEKSGGVRKLTLNELCQLLPGPNGKPSSLGRVRDAIRELSAVGLFSTKDGAPLTTSSSKRAAERPLLIRINDFPRDPASYEGPRNAFAVLERIRGEADGDPGWISNQGDGAGWKSSQVGQNSNQTGWKTNPEAALTSGNATSKEDLERRPRKEAAGGDGRRPSTGSRSVGGGGSAASGNTEPLPHKAPASSVRAVLESIPAPLALLLERDWPRGLPADVTRLVEEALTREQRTVEQVVERIARRWQVFGYEGALLSSEGEGLRHALGVLRELLSASKCWGNNLYCEDGADLRDGSLCPRCEEHRQDQRTAAGTAGTGADAAGDGGPSQHPPVDEEPDQTYTAPAYIPPPRGDAVGINESLAREARAAILAAKGAVPR